jgi:hypothetical protein
MSSGTVTAKPAIHGQPLEDFATTYDGPDQPPEDAIVGECIGEAVRKAWRAGYDPALPSFSVIVTFN